MWATSSSHPRGMVKIHSRREASAVSVGEGVGDHGTRGSSGARGGAPARGCLGTGARTAKEPIRERWTWVRSHAPSLPGIVEVLRTFLASPPLVQQIVGSPAASPAEAEAANEAEGATKKKGHTPMGIRDVLRIATSESFFDLFG